MWKLTFPVALTANEILGHILDAANLHAPFPVSSTESVLKAMGFQGVIVNGSVIYLESFQRPKQGGMTISLFSFFRALQQAGIEKDEEE